MATIVRFRHNTKRHTHKTLHVGHLTTGATASGGSPVWTELSVSIQGTDGNPETYTLRINRNEAAYLVETLGDYLKRDTSAPRNGAVVGHA